MTKITFFESTTIGKRALELLVNIFLLIVALPFVVLYWTGVLSEIILRGIVNACTSICISIAVFGPVHLILALPVTLIRKINWREIVLTAVHKVRGIK
jgi:hypothetical protein